jgi:AAA+ ATPase superfamily predicted ATPase
MFIARENELARLNKAYETPGMEVIVLLGRRRVGKTELIKESFKRNGLRNCYYFCGSSGEEQDTAEFSDVLAKAYPEEVFSFSRFTQALEYVFKKSEHERIVLAIDEFPNLLDDVPGVSAFLQKMIDEYQRKGTSHLKLIIAGSYLSAMKKMISPEGALYKRESFILLLNPMDYFDAAGFIPSATPKEKAMAYSVFGGLPYCLQEMAKYHDLKQAVVESMLCPGEKLSSFAGFVTDKELTKLTGANEIFSSLVRGNNTFSKLQGSTSFKEATPLTRILNALLEMELIEKVAPINDKNNKKKTFYQIKDGYLSFYYHYIHPNRSALSMMEPSVFFDHYIAPTLESCFCAKRFESITKEYLIRQNRKNALPHLYEDIGTFWYGDPIEKKNGQFDVALRYGKEFLLVECKFTNKPIGQSVVNEEVRQTKKLNLGDVSLGFASLSGFSLPASVQKAYYCIALKDMYL